MTAAPPTPTPLADRALAPDLARGFMLLLIVIANAPWYLWDESTRMISAHPLDASLLDRVVQTVAIVAIDGRTYPMFAFLFGYGIWQLYQRQLDAGASARDARRLLLRRHAWMLAFGAVHAALLWTGDILGAYGLAGLLVTWLFLRRKDRTLRVWAIVLTSLLLLSAIFSAIGAVFASIAPEGATQEGTLPFDLATGIAQPDYALSVVERLSGWVLLTPGMGIVALTVPVAILVAIVAARHRVLERPAAHLPLLRRTAVLGIGLGWFGGAITAAQNGDLLGIPPVLDWAFLATHSVTGLFCGIGYVALFGLIAARMQRVGKIASAMRAVGTRSLSSYLAQSAVFAPVMSAWGLGLGAHLSSWSITLFAIGTWLLTVAIAVLLERAGRRGPAEWLLRRLVYRKRPAESASATNSA